jgi:hypothetical protein
MCEMHVSNSLVVFSHITPAFLLAIFPSWFANTLLANAAICDTWFKPRSIFHIVCKIIQLNASKQNGKESVVFMVVIWLFLVTCCLFFSMGVRGKPRMYYSLLAGFLYRPRWTFQLWPPDAPATTDAVRTLAAEVGTYGRGIRNVNFA